jgi:hypothetical protein
VAAKRSPSYLLLLLLVLLLALSKLVLKLSRGEPGTNAAASNTNIASTTDFAALMAANFAGPQKVCRIDALAEAVAYRR